MPRRFTIVHETPGRIRFKTHDREFMRTHHRRISAAVRSLRGVKHVRVRPSIGGITVHYDHDAAEDVRDRVVKYIEQLALKEIEHIAVEELTNKVLGDGEAGSGALLTWLSLGALTLGETFAAGGLLAAASSPIFRRAARALFREHKLNVDVLDALATTILAGQGKLRTAAGMVGLISVGDLIRDHTLAESRRAIHGLFDGKARKAWVIRHGRKMHVSIHDIRPGEEIVAYPGELIPVDGAVLRGEAVIDQKILTGESLPVRKTRRDRVFAGTVVNEGKVYLRAEHVGHATLAARTVRMILDAPVRETRAQNYAEQFADRVVPWSLAAGGLLALFGALDKAASLLIVDYGTGIRVAGPTTVLASMTQAARRGVLIKGGRHLELLANADAIVFDKTGTLTTGKPEVVDVITYQQRLSGERLLALAASAEQRLTHPVSEAVVRAAAARHIRIPERQTSDYSIGRGVRARVNGNRLLVGSPKFMEAEHIAIDAARADIARLEERADSFLCVAVDGTLGGLIVYRDPLLPEAPEVIRALRERGVKEILMLTGDSPVVARNIAGQLGITNYVASAFPEQKVLAVRDLQRKGYTVAVVGDGINDSPALAQANVGIAVCGGAEVAQQAANVMLLTNSLWSIPFAIDTARDAMELIQQNWRWNLVSNTAAIVLAAIGLIGPVGSTLISNGATIVGMLNSLRPLLNHATVADAQNNARNARLMPNSTSDRPSFSAARSNTLSSARSRARAATVRTRAKESSGPA